MVYVRVKKQTKTVSNEKVRNLRELTVDKNRLYLETFQLKVGSKKSRWYSLL